MSGFRYGHFVVDSIVEVPTTVQEERVELRISAAVFLNIKVAFDHVPYDVILSTLED